MKIIPLLLFLLSDVLPGQAQSENRKVQDVVVNFFEALSASDLPGMQEYVTSDFTILEHGVIWTMDSVVALTTKAKPPGFKRINHFDFFQTVLRKDMAFVSYHNMAEVRTAEADRTVKWLESAVLVKEGRRWKVKMLHSTRLK
jgi:ketosteroid isomerase-like protein